MTMSRIRALPIVFVAVLASCLREGTDGPRPTRPRVTGSPTAQPASSMQIHYLEIVTPDVDATCTTLGGQHDVAFTDPAAELGNARTAELADGTLLGVRAPMHDQEQPIVRPYLLVDDLDAAVEAAKADGAEFAMEPTEIPGRGRFAIYFQGGIQYGLWER